MMKKSNKTKILAALLFSMVIFTFFIQGSFLSLLNKDETQEQPIQKDDEIKYSAVTDLLYIDTEDDDYNWTASKKEYSFITGSGTPNDPYLISNTDFNGQNTHGGITINNSKSWNFKIKNCRFYNIGSLDSLSAAIQIVDSWNGTITDCDLSSSLDGNYGMLLTNGTREMTITNNNFTNFKYAIYAESINQNIISENTIDENEVGIYFKLWCNSNEINDNYLSENSIAGIFITEMCWGNKISGNIINNNVVFGVLIAFSGGNEIYDNNSISNNGYGIYMTASGNNEIRNNTIVSNDADGIYLSGCFGNNFTRNIIKNNVEVGVHIDESGGDSLYNFIYENDFINNGEHAIDYEYSNNWSKNKVGNKWDNYTALLGAADDDDDGVGDNPYNFTGGRDEYPIFNDGISLQNGVISINATSNHQYNWTWAQGRFWFSGGSGSSGDPYIISPNIFWKGIIDGNGRTCISINNSGGGARFFVIEDLTLSNSGGSNAGILLHDTDNGIIQNNNCSFNGYGVDLYGAHNITITQNIINNNTKAGIRLYNESGEEYSWIPRNWISENSLSGNYDGIYITEDSHKNEVTGNIISNSDNYGVYIADATCNYTLIYENTFKNRKSGTNAFDNGVTTNWTANKRGNSWDDYPYAPINGKDADDDGIGDDPYDEIDGFANAIDEYPIYEDNLDEYALYIDGIATGPGAHNWTWASERLFITGVGSANNPYIIRDMSFNGSKIWNNNPWPKCGITIINTDDDDINFRIENCTIYEAVDAGIYLNNASRGTIVNNTIEDWANPDLKIGIHLTNSSSLNNISYNRLDSFDIGLLLNGSCYGNDIMDNFMEYNDWGIFFEFGCGGNILINNTLSNNNFAGLSFNISSGGNNVSLCTISNNLYGILLDIGSQSNKIFENAIVRNVGIGGRGVLILDNDSAYNYFYKNNFTGNTINVIDDGTYNRWNTTVGTDKIGNFWWNYTEVSGHADDDDDGIGDVPYNIRNSTGDWINVDGYPIYDDGHNGDQVYIDGMGMKMDYMNWNTVEEKSWCSGSGSFSDPYIISGLRINAGGLNNCITLRDSAVSVVFDDCKGINGEDGGGEYFAGLRLINVQNVTIINCNFSLNGDFGIYLNSSCSKINIKNNILENNGMSGIYGTNYISDSEIHKNNITDNALHGIHLYKNCDNNTIKWNTINDHSNGAGIRLENTSENNLIYNNWLSLNSYAINLEEADYNDIIKNVIADSTTDGIYLEDRSSNFKISLNEISGSTESGINFVSVTEFWYWRHDVTIIDNDIYDNDEYGIELRDAEFCYIINNTLRINDRGIGVVKRSSQNNITGNDIFDNFVVGLYFSIDCGGNYIYKNNFTGNFEHADDSAIFPIENRWYTNPIGNYWDDYGDKGGKDGNDDGRGDNGQAPYNPFPYSVPSLMNVRDLYPIWWDAPTIKNKKIQENDKFTTTAPQYDIQVIEGRGSHLWYSIDGYGVGPVFRKLNGDLNEGVQGSIDSIYWKTIPNKALTLRFWINDTDGLTNFTMLHITKENTTQITPPAPPADNGDSDGDSDTTTEGGLLASEEEGGLPWYLQAIFTGIISASAGLVIKVTYSAQKRRKLLYRKIGDNIDKVDNIEKFLQDKLGFEDWQKLQESWKRYQNDEISQKKLIKDGRKNIGKHFTSIFVKPKKSVKPVKKSVKSVKKSVKPVKKK